MANQSYPEGLTDSDCKEYKNKLVLGNGMRFPDPQQIDEAKWSANASKWPFIIWPYTYLIDTQRVRKEKSAGLQVAGTYS